MPWHARLQLDYTVENDRSVARFLHHGPLRILQSLYPEGDAVCHNVLVHPPGGLVGGDRLDVNVTVGPGAHGLVTTPGATRFYRSEGGLAEQRVKVRLESGARLEWLPMEAIAHSGCDALNHAVFDLAPGAEIIGWDVTALGLPSANAPFDTGRFAQHLELQGAWLERGRMDASDRRLLDSPWGWPVTGVWPRCSFCREATWRATGATRPWRWRGSASSCTPSQATPVRPLPIPGWWWCGCSHPWWNPPWGCCGRSGPPGAPLCGEKRLPVPVSGLLDAIYTIAIRWPRADGCP